MIPPQSLVLTYPYPVTGTAQVMLWQAETGMRFRLRGGYVVAPDASGAGTFFADSNAWEDCLTEIYDSGTTPTFECNTADLWADLERLGVTAIVDDPSAPFAQVAATLVTSVVANQPRSDAGVLLWRCQGGREAATCRWG